MADHRVDVRFLGSGDAFGDGGRYQACILIQTSSARMLMDCGATSLTAMKRFRVDPGSIDTVIVSHYHADHYGGIPFLILDGQFSHRTNPLAIAGPGDVERRVTTAMKAAFPGSSIVRQRFPISFHQLQAGGEIQLGRHRSAPSVPSTLQARTRSPCVSPPTAR